MNTAMKLIEVGLIGAGVAAFCWWQFRDLRIEREKTAARAAASPLQADDPDRQAAAKAGDPPSQDTGRAA